MTSTRDFRPEEEPDPTVWQDEQGYEPGVAAASGSGPTGQPAGYAPNWSGAAGQPAQYAPSTPGGDPTTGAGPTAGGTPGSGPADPTTPLPDDSSGIDSTIAGPGQGGGPLFGDSGQKVAGLAHPQHAPTPSDYTDHYHHLNEGDYQQNENFAHGKDPWALLDGDVSPNDRDRLAFGVQEPSKRKAADDAHARGKQQLGQYANSINGGDVEAVGTADQILSQGEPGLAFFKFFGPAYNDWKGGGITYADAKRAYDAETGMSFTDYVSDSRLVADIGQQLQSVDQGLNNAYNTLVPTWQGAAASNFEAKMQVFFQATNTVTTDLAVIGRDIAALVQGLQQLVLAKAQAVSELYVAELPTGIDGVMASSLVKVAKGEGTDEQNLIAFKLLSGNISAFEAFLLDVGFAGLLAAEYAPRMATQWCNEILVPQFETREQALKTINSQTKTRIQKGFQELTSQLSRVSDPYTGMDKAGTGATGQQQQTQPQTQPQQQAGGAAPGGASPGGVPGVPAGGGQGPAGASPSVTVPQTSTAGPTVPAGVTTPQGTAPAGQPDFTGLPSGSATSGLPGADPTVGMSAGSPVGTTGPTTRPAGLPPGSSWIPSGVPLPQGWSQDPTTGEALPEGWSVDPATGAPTPPAGMTAAGRSATGTRPQSPGMGVPGQIDPNRDIHKNADGSVSLGPDRGLTISPETGRKGMFTVSDTDADGTRHTYRIHFDEHGNPVVTEERPADQPTDAAGPADAAGLADTAGPAGAPVPGVTPGGTSPTADLGGGGIGAATAAGSGGGGVGGPGGIDGGAPGGPSGGGSGAVPAGAVPSAPAAHAGDTQLQDGTYVGADNSADNAMGATGAQGAGSQPAGGDAPAGQGSDGGEHGGAFGGVPMAGGARAGGGQEQESARRYPQRGDVVGEQDLEEWQRMGPVIGER